MRGRRRGTRAQMEEGAEDRMCDTCYKVCATTTGLKIHRRRMYGESAMKAMFKCEQCGTDFKKMVSLLNHEKACAGGRPRMVLDM